LAITGLLGRSGGQRRGENDPVGPALEVVMTQHGKALHEEEIRAELLRSMLENVLAFAETGGRIELMFDA
jgi:hypothetical protein